MSNFIKARYNNVSEVKDYILRIDLIASWLKELKVPVADDFLVHRVLNSSLIEFEQLKIS